MADTYTEFLNLTKPEIGASRDTWGDKWNSNAAAIDAWAKLTDALAKAALSKTATGAQTVAPNVILQKGLNITGGESSANASIEIGGVAGAATTPFIDFHSGATIADYDARIIATGGNGQIGKGSLSYLADLHSFSGAITATAGGITASNGQVTTSGASASLRFNDRTMNYNWELYAQGDTARIFKNGTGAGDKLISYPDGNISTPFYGYLNNFIAAADNAVTTQANARMDGNFVNKTTTAVQQMLAQLQIVSADPGYRTLNNSSGGDFITRAVNGIFQWCDGAKTVEYLRLATDGAITTRQFGDLNNRIEARAAAFADDRAQYRVAKTGDTMTGDLSISKNYPQVGLNYPNVDSWQIQLRENGRLYFYCAGSNSFAHSFGQYGDYSNAQIGDLNSRIEARASAYAANMVASVRLGTRNQFNYNGLGSAEPAPGQVVVGFNSDNQGKAYNYFVRGIQYVLGNGSVGNAPTT